MSYRNQAYLFIALVLAISWSFEAFMVLNGGVRHFGIFWFVALMCIPGAVSLLLRLLLRSGFDDVSFRPGRPGTYVLAIGIPALLALLSCLAADGADIRQFSALPPGQFRQILPTLLMLIGLGLFGAFGEELGWRGFLLPRLVQGRVRRPYLVTGLVWAAWHLPLIAFGGFYQTDYPLMMAMIYAVGILALNAVFCELRMRSGSIWVPTLAHASHNFLFQFVLPVMLLTVPGSRSGLWDPVVGDTGLTLAALYLAAYVVLRRSAFARGSGGCL